MKSLICAAVVATALTIPALSFAQGSQITRAQVRAELASAKAWVITSETATRRIIPPRFSKPKRSSPRAVAKPLTVAQRMARPSRAIAFRKPTGMQCTRAKRSFGGVLAVEFVVERLVDKPLTLGKRRDDSGVFVEPALFL